MHGLPVHDSIQMNAQREKRGFFARVFHPLHKPEPKPVADFKHRICFGKHCSVCTPDHDGRSCGLVTQNSGFCSQRQVWYGDPCMLGVSFMDDCVGMRATMDGTEQRVQAALADRQVACAPGPSQACTEANVRVQSESSFYQTLQGRYQGCEMQSRSPRSSNASAAVEHSPSRLSEPIR